MIDCKCGTTVLNLVQLDEHIIRKVVLEGDQIGSHGIDHNGPTLAPRPGTSKHNAQYPRLDQK